MGKGVIWSVAPESNIQYCLKGISEALSPNENGELSNEKDNRNIPGRVKEQVPDGFSNLLRRDLTFSTSLRLRCTPPSRLSPLVLTTMCACPLFLDKSFFYLHSLLGGRPINFQHFSRV